MEKISTVVHSVHNKDGRNTWFGFQGPNTNSVAGFLLFIAPGEKTWSPRAHEFRAYDPVAIPEARMELNGNRPLLRKRLNGRGPKAWMRWVVGTGWPRNFRGPRFRSHQAFAEASP